jgi:PAS domain S-box-containing protein
MDGDMNYDEINKLRLRIEDFTTLVSSRLTSQPDDLLEITIENLNNSLEELATAEEELKNQNEALLETRQALEEQRQRYLDLFDFAPGGYLETDLEGKILEANMPAALLLNFRQKSMAGRILTNLVDLKDRRSVRTMLTKAMLQVERKNRGEKLGFSEDIHQLPEIEIRFRPLKGEPFTAAVNTGIVRRGEKPAIRWLIRDVTEQVRAKEALHENEYRFRMLAERTALFIMVVQEGGVSYINPAACRLTGYSQEELLGKNPLQVFHRDHWQDLMFLKNPEGEAKDHNTRNHASIEIMLETKHGKECWIDAGTARLVVQGKPGWVLTGYDITKRLIAERERKNLMQRLVNAQEEERQRISLELHDQMGQEIIALILGLNSFEGDLPVEAREKAQRLKEIAQGLRSELHRLAHELHPAILKDLGLSGALSSFVEEWSERHNINVDIQTYLKETVLPENISMAIYRIVQEALTNITKHAGAKSVSIVLDEQPGRLVVIIEDDGCGFEPEQVLEKSVNDKKLGIIGMRERAELVGGSLVIESERNQGTSVFLRIPFSRE